MCTAGYVPSHAESAACFPRAPPCTSFRDRALSLRAGAGELLGVVLDSLMSCRPQLLHSLGAVCDFAPGPERPEAAAQVNGAVG